MILYRIGRAILRFFCRINHSLTAKGVENIPTSGRAIIACNHRCASDPIYHACSIRQKLYFIAKKELFSFKPLGALLRALGAFPVDRAAIDRNAMRNAVELLEQDKMLLIFPEGTRSRDGTLGVFKNGAASFALQAGAPIVPAAIIMPHGKGFFKPVRIIYGEPITIEELRAAGGGNGESESLAKTTRAATALIRERISSLIEQGYDLWK